MAAKMSATVDHISGGRMGLNAVAGYHQPEYRMFGLGTPRARRALQVGGRVDDESSSGCGPTRANEFEFDFDGDYFKLGVRRPSPSLFNRPVPMVMSAGSSPAGQRFAFDHANILFAGIDDVNDSKPAVTKLRKNADEAGRRRPRFVGGCPHRVQGHREGSAWTT